MNIFNDIELDKKALDYNEIYDIIIENRLKRQTQAYINFVNSMGIECKKIEDINLPRESQLKQALLDFSNDENLSKYYESCKERFEKKQFIVDGSELDLKLKAIKQELIDFQVNWPDENEKLIREQEEQKFIKFMNENPLPEGIYKQVFYDIM